MGGGPSIGKKRKHGAGWIVLIAAAVVLGPILVVRWRDLGFHWSEFAGAFRSVHWLWVVAAVAFGLSTHLGRALRWQVLLRPVKPVSDLWNLTVATAIGFTATILFGRAGELVRPYLISVKERVPFPSQVAAWLVERIFDLLTALLIFGFALSRVQSSGVSVGGKLTWVLHVGGYFAAGAAVVALILILVFNCYGTSMRSRLADALAFLPEGPRLRIWRVLDAFAQGVECTRSPAFLLQLSFYSLLEWTLIVGVHACLFRSFPETAYFHLTDVLLFVGFVAFGAVVQIPGIGGGVQVVAILVLTELFGLGLELASGIALLLWITTIVAIVPLGLILSFREGLNWRRLKQIQEGGQPQP